MEEKVGDSRMMGDTEGLSLSEWAEKADSIVLATAVSIDEAKTVLPVGCKMN